MPPPWSARACAMTTISGRSADCGASVFAGRGPRAASVTSIKMAGETDSYENTGRESYSLTVTKRKSHSASPPRSTPARSRLVQTRGSSNPPSRRPTPPRTPSPRAVEPQRSKSCSAAPMSPVATSSCPRTPSPPRASRFYALIRLCRGGRGYGIARRSSCGRRNDGLRLGWFPRGGAR
jgi:hypothetical protein